MSELIGRFAAHSIRWLSQNKWKQNGKRKTNVRLSCEQQINKTKVKSTQKNGCKIGLFCHMSLYLQIFIIMNSRLHFQNLSEIIVFFFYVKENRDFKGKTIECERH